MGNTESKRGQETGENKDNVEKEKETPTLLEKPWRFLERKGEWSEKMNQYLPQHFANNFSLIDTMGITEANAGGIHIDDTKALMEGKFTVLREFNPATPIRSDAKPTLEEVGHCTVIVIDAKVLQTDSLTETLEKTFQTIQDNAKQCNQRTVVVLTHIDQACEEIGEDITLVYKSRKMYDIVKKARDKFGVPIK